MKRIIVITFFVLVELWFFLTLLIPFAQPSWGLTWLFSNWIYYLGVLLFLIVPIHHLTGKKNEWLWVVMYYQLVCLSPFVLLIQWLANE